MSLPGGRLIPMVLAVARTVSQSCWACARLWRDGIHPGRYYLIEWNGAFNREFFDAPTPGLVRVGRCQRDHEIARSCFFGGLEMDVC